MLEVQTLILRSNDLEKQLLSANIQAANIQNALITFRLEKTRELLRLGAEVWPADLRILYSL